MIDTDFDRLSEAAMLGTLFETIEDRAAAHAQLIADGKPVRGLRATERQRRLIYSIACRKGASHAISIGELAERMKTTPRCIKSDVRELRLMGARIGSSRDSEDGGLYLITTAEEWRATVAPYLKQLRSEAAVIRAFSEPHELLELEGQLSLQEAGV